METPYQTLTGDTDVDNAFATYSAGMSYNFTEDFKGRASYATGFRTPTGAEIAGEYTPVLTPNSITRGNPDLDPETSEQFEIGVTYAMDNYFLDVAFFDNTITDRIKKQLFSNEGTTRIYQSA